ncbi:MAG TPA: triose-phosphate isomerase [Candidatus Paceibacterota bacterium]|nr:triose-phosphate isomerase [Candidatus Paceibacterota bacterium]
MSKKFFIIGNWKMNPETLEKAKDICVVEERAARFARRTSVVICPPYPYLSILAQKKKSIAFGVQDIFYEKEGAYTGSVSASIAKSAGAKFSIIGHSERRATGDTDDIVAKKFLAAFEGGLTPILCIGEKVRDDHGDYFAEVRTQLFSALRAANTYISKPFIIAYEPVWAVGKSYDTALTPEGMNEMVIFIRKSLSQFLEKNKVMKVPVLYGGSVNGENAQTMLTHGGVDGLLIGRQSLDPTGFSHIIKFANSL